MTIEAKDAHTIELIDGLYVPCTIFGTESPNGEPGTTTYWGAGYPTATEAMLSLRAFEAGNDNPPGVPVSMDTGKRRD